METGSTPKTWGCASGESHTASAVTRTFVQPLLCMLKPDVNYIVFPMFHKNMDFRVVSQHLIGGWWTNVSDEHRPVTFHALRA